MGFTVLPQVQIPKNSVISSPEFVLNFSKQATLNDISSKPLRTELLELDTNPCVLKLKSSKLESLAPGGLPQCSPSSLRYES